MKKILIIAMVVASSIAANAAATKWSFTSAAMKCADLKTAYTSTVQIWASGGDLDSAVMIGSKTASNGTVSGYAFETESLTVGESYNIYYVLTDTQGGVDYTLTSATKSLTAQKSSTTSIGFGSQAAYTATASNWVAAPEPTSALLMLFGMAGLALKRKRA